MRLPPSFGYVKLILSTLLSLLAAAHACGEETAVDFQNEIAAILRDRCLECHSEKSSGGLRLDSGAALLQGGDSGAAVTPGKSVESQLIARVTASDESDEKMPPAGPRLTSEQIERLTAWIDAGAQWPDGVVLQSPRAAAATHWSFQPITSPLPPPDGETSQHENPIDAFIAARLESEAVAPSPEADKRTLWRRVTLDLTGLPPAELDAKGSDPYLSDDSPGAYERLVDRLLASPAYGERWARPWLDLCHYADTDGYLTDQERPVAWRYRQWLIAALNRDLPFDRFTIEQLAGDLLPEKNIETLIATGFSRNTLSNREGGADLEEYRVEQIVDRATMVGQGWLRLTVGCARCHDHKFDPVGQDDFYKLYAFFNDADEVNIDAPLPGEAPFSASDAEYRQKRDAILAPVLSEVESLQAQWEAKMLAAVAAPGKEPLWDRQWEVLGLIWGGHFGEGQLEGCVIVETPVAERTHDEKDRLLDYFLARGSLIDENKFADLKLAEIAKQLDELRASVRWPTRAPTMRKARIERTTRVHLRGDFRTPGEEVSPAVLSWLGTEAQEGGARKTRLDLAKWLVGDTNPLTARVTVNGMWQEFFGRGLVDPPSDFGLRGQPPSHPELLDWLASELMRRQWSVKELHRLIVTSATYKQSSKSRSDLTARDPDNRLLARQIPLRFSSDQVRDSALAVSGLLEPRLGGPSVFPPQPESVAKEGFSNAWKTSEGADRYRRGLYTWLQRLSPFAQNVTFDAPPTNSICARRDRSNSPLQALTLLNDPVFFEAAQALAARLEKGAFAADAERIDALYRWALARPPTATESQILNELLAEQRNESADEQAAWVSACSVVLNLHEFITRD